MANIRKRLEALERLRCACHACGRTLVCPACEPSGARDTHDELSAWLEGLMADAAARETGGPDAVC